MTSASHSYVGFGVTVRSNWALPGLQPGARRGPAVNIEFAEANGPSVDADLGPPAACQGPETLWRLADGSWLLRHVHPLVKAAWTMRISAHGERIDVRWTDGTPKDDLVQVVQAAGLGASLNRMGEPVLHACAVDVGGDAIVLVGQSGAGKSTTAGAFVAAGHALMTDDIAALQIRVGGGAVVHPGAARLRLQPHAARALGWDPDALPRVFSSGLAGDKRYVRLSVDEGTFCRSARPVTRLCLLETRRHGGPIVEAVSSAAALPALVENTYAARLLDGGRRAELFVRYAELIQGVPVCRVHPPDSLEDVGQLVEALTADLA